MLQHTAVRNKIACCVMVNLHELTNTAHLLALLSLAICDTHGSARLRGQSAMEAVHVMMKCCMSSHVVRLICADRCRLKSCS